MISQTQLQGIKETTTKLVEQEKKEQEASKTPSYFKPNPNNYAFEGRNVGGSIGFALGVAYGFKVSSGFLKGWGYAIIGSIVLGGIGYGIGMSKKKNK